jgi:hypothetical protein
MNWRKEFMQVNKKHLEEFRLLLEISKSRKEIIGYFDKYIMQIEKTKINELKKDIYKDLKNTTGEKNKKLYALYQQLKKGTIDYYDAWNEYICII